MDTVSLCSATTHVYIRPKPLYSACQVAESFLPAKWIFRCQQEREFLVIRFERGSRKLHRNEFRVGFRRNRKSVLGKREKWRGYGGGRYYWIGEVRISKKRFRLYMCASGHGRYIRFCLTCVSEFENSLLIMELNSVSKEFIDFVKIHKRNN